MAHQPVLLNEVARALNLQEGEVLVDATLNRGGHAAYLCLGLGSRGGLVGIDADGEALAAAKANLAQCPGRLELVKGNFRHLPQLLAPLKLARVDAILMDLGLSTDQLEASRRGFSFQRDEPLLMSFNEAPEEGGLTAAAILNQWSEGELAKIFSELGEERFARRIARAVVTRRQEKTIIGTQELVAIIEGAVPGWYRGLRRHSATKIFQALRMAVNDELEALAEGLAAAWRLLPQGGRLAVISFHSGEARLVKEFCRSRVGEGTAEWVGKRVTHPSQAEILANPAARSAQLRAILKK